MHARLTFKKDTEISYKYTQNIQEEKKNNNSKKNNHTQKTKPPPTPNQKKPTHQEIYFK